MTAHIAVLGGGSFGTVIANIMAENGYQVRQWLRDPEIAEKINQTHQNARYLPDYSLSEQLIASTDMEWVIRDAEAVFVSIPSSSFRNVVQQAKAWLQPQQLLISTTKGVEASSFKLMSHILREEVPNGRIGVLSGPNLAKEIAKGHITASVIASDDEALCSRVQSILCSKTFRAYASQDVFGVELGGTLKNIYAIASGLSAALGVGENTKSMLITRSLAEMSRFAVAKGANPMTFLGLSGIGDLIVTCTSPLSRNYRVGFALGQGKSLDDAVTELGEVAEGVNTLKEVRQQAQQYDIYMPLVMGLYEVVFNHAPVKQVIAAMMSNQPNVDVDFAV
ncbi:NAD(P)H-dependent glycerol-3-phosphate dehydrogenase [Alkalimonas collagenimarina]|uniref:Glycerol-3-phosphate dehydrogenase [NAD(P)+] n=1 Tax=Alkalimonas collagenimarina TaxID=400390 RepID=A0ABT9H0R2_9GAMM|nr:NAD(P)H-dependent glycerol-3-phosphate dehydrogenase [Alkalimonas collagenimarina]MDP4536897.1 NAD(P)H-dependent glycerol-3-phosphate dehydrogenase [Alkalimonas collagenimarina]